MLTLMSPMPLPMLFITMLTPLFAAKIRYYVSAFEYAATPRHDDMLSPPRLYT